MCVAVPGQIVWIGGERAVATRPARIRIGDVERNVDLVMVPDARVGDWVITHSGYAIRRLAATAVEAWARDVGSAEGQPVTTSRWSSDPTASTH